MILSGVDSSSIVYYTPRFLLASHFQMALNRPDTGTHLLPMKSSGVFLFEPALCFFPVLCAFGILDLVVLKFFLNGLFLFQLQVPPAQVLVRNTVFVFFQCWLHFFLGPAFG